MMRNLKDLIYTGVSKRIEWKAPNKTSEVVIFEVRFYDGQYVADKSIEEIKTIISNGGTVKVRFHEGHYMVELNLYEYNIEESHFEFGCPLYGSNPNYYYSFVAHYGEEGEDVWDNYSNLPE